MGRLALLLLPAAAAALAAFGLPGHTQPIERAPAPPPEASAMAPAPATAAAAAPAPAPTGDRRCELGLPDGTFVPALNGAAGARPLAAAWGNWPWSPIVGTERTDAGVEWYVHADGSRSTTEMKWRSDLGRLDAMTRVAHPGPQPGPAAPH